MVRSLPWNFMNWSDEMVALRRIFCAVILIANLTFAFSGGDGTPQNPYQISTRQDLESVNNDLAASYILINDIDLSGTTYTKAVIAPNVDGAGSFEGVKFTGNFDGDGFVIENLTIDGGTSNHYIGLFGAVGSSVVMVEIKNLGLLNCNINGRNNIGGVAGLKSSGLMSNCYAEGSVSGSFVIGGLIGYDDSGQITQCYSKGEVNGLGYYLGGLIGYCDNGEVSESYSTVNITGVIEDFSNGEPTSSNRIGGFVGQNTGTISNCYAIGEVSGANDGGGFVGYNRGIIQNSYSTGKVNVAFAGGGGFAGYSAESVSCFWDTQTSGYTSCYFEGIVGKTTTEMKTESTFIDTGWDFVSETANGTNDIWNLQEGCYPTLAWQGAIQIFTVTFDLDGHGVILSGSEIQSIQSGNYAVAPAVKADAGYIFTGWDIAFDNVTSDLTVVAQYDLMAGTGSAENPYQISTLAGLEAVNNGLGASYVLTNDIDMAGKVYLTAVLAPNISTTPDFVGEKFSGSFDGNGFSINNLKIYDDDWRHYLGLFGYIDGGEVKNLTLNNCDVYGDNPVGALAGTNTGSLTNCHVSGLVNGYQFVGGLVGENSGSVTNCNATVIMDSYYGSSGGLIGYNYHGSITGCYSEGSITGDAYLGGLIGIDSGDILNCYSTAIVNGSLFIGGLVGKHSSGSIMNCYSTGRVTGNSDVGGLIGTRSDYYPGTVTGCFWNIETSGLSVSDGGIGKTTEQMQSLDTFFFEDWQITHYDTGHLAAWGIRQQEYPFLWWEDAAVENGEIIQVPDLTGLTLEQCQDALQNAGFTIGETIYVSSLTVAEGEIAELSVIEGDYYMNTVAPVIIFVSTGAIGDGSIDNPYNVFTKSDLEAINSKLGVNYILMNDIDLSGTTYTRNVIAPESEARFTGSFDGNGFEIRNLRNSAGSLFGYIGEGGEVCDLALVDCEILNSNNYTGALAAYNYGDIIRCYSTGVITGGNYVGCLVGYNNSGNIIESYCSGNVNGNSYVGGLVGYNNSGSIINSYCSANVTATSRVGGLVGYGNDGSIINSYSTGNITGDFDIGGLIGDRSGYYPGIVSGCFWNIETSGQTQSEGGEGKTTEELKSIQTFIDAGWQFTDYDTNHIGDWYMPEEGCPLLWWQDDAINLNEVIQLPDLTGLTFEESKAALEAAGFTIGEVSYISSLVVAEGEIISTSLVQGDNYINSVGPVNIIVSTGIGGNGTIDSPYQIFTKADFMAINNDLSANYILMKDISFFGSTYSIALIAPDYDTKFSGSFNGNGFSISDLTINGLGDYVGLFGYVSNTGKIKNIALKNFNISGDRYVGSLAGYSLATITNCSSTGEVYGSAEQIGGLLGHNYGNIAGCCYTGKVTGEDDTGGLVGCNVGVVAECYSNAEIVGEDFYTGGLVGSNTGDIAECYAIGEVIGDDYTGGLVGGNNGDIVNSYSYSEVTGEDKVGGLVGYSRSGNISYCYSIGVVTGINYIGGLVGYNFDGNVISCFWDIEASSQNISYGGEPETTYQMKEASTFIGWNDGSWTIDNSNDYPRLSWENSVGETITTDYPNATYSGAGTQVDPFVLSTPLDLVCMSKRHMDWGSCFMMANDIDMADILYVPIVKFSGNFNGNGCRLLNLTIDSEVVGLGEQLGLFGKLMGEVYNLGLQNVIITGNCDFVASLAGYNSSGIIANCYSTGSVTGNNNIGGLVGKNDLGNIYDCYSEVAVYGYENVGGLVGYNYLGLVYSYPDNIINCYSTGEVTGYQMAGGLIGHGDDGSYGCFWDIETSGLMVSRGGEGKTTEQMKSIQTFIDSGWQFTDYQSSYIGDWFMPQEGYPLLWWQDDTINSGEIIYVPDLEGLTFEQSRDALENSGFTIGEITYVSSLIATEGEVAWTSLVKGASYVSSVGPVDIFISTGPLGDGSIDNPYGLFTKMDLEAINNDLGANYILMNDISLSGTTYTTAVIAPDTSMSSGYNGTEFTGSIDGNGFSIVDLEIDGDLGDYLGLLGYISVTGEIKNIALKNCNIIGDEYIGALVGYNLGVINNCYSTGEVTGNRFIGGFAGYNNGSIIGCYSTSLATGEYYAGGLVGYNFEGSIIGCYSVSLITGKYYAGGLAGYNKGDIADSYSTSEVNGDYRIGGLLGGNKNGSIINSYSTGKVTGDNESGGLVGYNFEGDTTGCFWDKETSGQAASAGGVGKTTAQMQLLDTFIDAGWDFAAEGDNGQMEVWYMLEGDYPRLYWQADKGDVNYDGFVDELDLDVIISQWLNVAAENQRLVGDIDESGVVDNADFAIYAEQMLPPSADINEDGSVDELDLFMLCDAWLTDGYGLAADLDENGIVDLADYAVLALQW